ncbi:12431_t:CDS:2, partial [Funneliformis mosseae]
FIKSKTHECEAYENGAGVTHSGSTGHDDGSKVYTSDRTTLMSRLDNVFSSGKELRLDPSPNVGDLVHKEGYLYSIKLSNSNCLI